MSVTQGLLPAGHQGSLAWTGALLGAVCAGGMLLAWRRLPARRRPGLEDRMEPYLRDTPRPSRLISVHQAGEASVVRAAAQPLLDAAARRLGSLVGGERELVRRLARAGSPLLPVEFRVEQVIWGICGAIAGLVLGVLLVLNRDAAGVIPGVLTLCGAAGGVLARDQMLSRSVATRESHILTEFPTIAELLALSVSAGEGTVPALERVCRLSSGELAGELRLSLNDARAGATLPVALQGLADRTGLVSLIRFVDGVLVALERGTPLAEVLRAQAQDVREEGRRAVMDAAGKKEIGMMIPVVFLVLPVTILFAVYPGFAFLQFSV